MNNRKGSDRFKKCYRCQETNTKVFYAKAEEKRVVVFGWCNTCEAGFSYSERIDDVKDKEERL